MLTCFYTNFYRSIYICSLSLSTISFGINATEFDSNEFSEKVLVCDNANDQVDNFIEVCIEYQKKTGKKFDYKKFLRKTYKYLEDQNVYIPKDIKKEVEQSVKERLAELLSENNNLERAFQNQTLNRYRRERPNTNNDVRNSVLRTTAGVMMICVPCPIVQAAGVYIAGREVDYLYDYTKKCFVEMFNGNTRDTKRDRERDSQGFSERRKKRDD